MTEVPRAGRGWPALLLMALTLGLLSSCGGTSSGGLSAATAGVLHHDVQTIKLAASGHDAGRAHAAVATLRTEIARLAARGELNRADARVLEADASQVDARVTAQVKPLSAAPASTTPTTAAPAAPAAPAGHGKGPGHGGDKGNGKGPGKGPGKGGAGGGD